MPEVPALTNRIIDEFANQLYAVTTRADAVVLGFEGDDLEAIGRAVWEKATPALHDFFRERAIKLLRGDLSVLPGA